MISERKESDGCMLVSFQENDASHDTQSVKCLVSNFRINLKLF